MTLAGAGGSLAFNLLVNAVGSFAVGAALASLAALALRAPDGRWRQFFLVLPLAKVAADLAYGVPAGSFFWARLAGESQDKGSFQFGLGVTRLVPMLHLSLGALKDGVARPQSVAEPCATALARHGGPDAPAAVAAGVLVVGALLLGRRVSRAVRSLREASRIRATAAIVDRRRVALRTVDVVVADRYDGVPFAAGVLRPFVCLSRRDRDALTLEERDAVVRHELGHVAGGDLLLFAVLGLFADFLWFVPGLRARCRGASAQAEIAADRWATARGAAPAALASALVRVAERARPAPDPDQALALFRCEPLLVRRVRALLDAPAGRPRSSAKAIALRVAGAIWIAAAVFASTSCGNR